VAISHVEVVPEVAVVEPASEQVEPSTEDLAQKAGAPVQGFEFTAQQSDLANVLPMLAKLANSPYHAVLHEVLIEVRESDVVLTTFNLSTALRVCVPATVTTPGIFTAPAVLLSDLVTRLPDEPLTFQHIPDEQMLVIKSSVGTHRMNGLGPDDYPNLPEFKGQPIQIDSSFLEAALGRVSFSASSDETKQILTGIRLSLGAGDDSRSDGCEFEAAATDGHRLSLWQGELKSSVPTRHFTVPAASADRIRKVLDIARKTGAVDEPVMCSISMDDEITPTGELLPTCSFLRVQAGVNMVIVRLLDG
jgi:DNA polymerase-3 subunit beta